MRDRSKRTIRIYAIELSAVDHHSYPLLYAVIIESGRKGGREGGIKETGTSKSILWRRAREEENYSRVGFEHIYIYIFHRSRMDHSESEWKGLYCRAKSVWKVKSEEEEEEV